MVQFNHRASKPATRPAREPQIGKSTPEDHSAIHQPNRPDTAANSRGTGHGRRERGPDDRTVNSAGYRGADCADRLLREPVDLQEMKVLGVLCDDVATERVAGDGDHENRHGRITAFNQPFGDLRLSDPGGGSYPHNEDSRREADRGQARAPLRPTSSAYAQLDDSCRAGAPKDSRGSRPALKPRYKQRGGGSDQDLGKCRRAGRALGHHDPRTKQQPEKGVDYEQRVPVAPGSVERHQEPNAVRIKPVACLARSHGQGREYNERKRQGVRVAPPLGAAYAIDEHQQQRQQDGKENDSEHAVSPSAAEDQRQIKAHAHRGRVDIAGIGSKEERG